MVSTSFSRGGEEYIKCFIMCYEYQCIKSLNMNQYNLFYVIDNVIIHVCGCYNCFRGHSLKPSRHNGVRVSDSNSSQTMILFITIFSQPKCANAHSSDYSAIVNNSTRYINRSQVPRAISEARIRYALRRSFNRRTLLLVRLIKRKFSFFPVTVAFIEWLTKIF